MQHLNLWGANLVHQTGTDLLGSGQVGAEETSRNRTELPHMGCWWQRTGEGPRPGGPAHGTGTDAVKVTPSSPAPAPLGSLVGSYAHSRRRRSWKWPRYANGELQGPSPVPFLLSADKTAF